MARRELGPTALRVGQAVAELLPSGPVVVGVSGGADSMALALGAVWASPRTRSEVLCVVVDHGRLTRGEFFAELLKDGWSTLYPMNTYLESTADATEYEQPWDKEGKFPATLPLNTAELSKKNGPGVIRTTPFGNTLTFEMAKAAIEGESLGARLDETDFLAMSHSATDYVGHRYGTFAVETEDTYLRLDKDLADFLSYLDGKFGRDGYLFVLTADHAAAHNLTFNRDHKIPGQAYRSDQA